MVNCCVATCKNDSRNSTSVIYHTFPKDASLCSAWAVKCKRADAINTKNARVCSDNFVPTDYSDDMKNRILGLPAKKLLRHDAIPSINLGLTNNPETNVKLREERVIKRTITKTALEHISTISPKKVRLEESVICKKPDKSDEHQVENECSNCSKINTEMQVLKNRLDVLQKELVKAKAIIRDNRKKR